ncbi:hypothetical protein PV326_011945, partial [Microctonus aethiopoides]
MANEEGSDKRASSLEDSSVANLNESISISKDNGEAKGATRKRVAKNINNEKTKSKLKIIKDQMLNLLDEVRGTDEEIDLFANQNEARCSAEELRGDIVPNNLERAVDSLNMKFNLLMRNFDSLKRANDLSSRNLPPERGRETTSKARSAEVKLLNRKNFENYPFESNRDRNRLNIENEEFIENIVENSRVESLIGGPRRERNMLGATHVESVLFTPASALCRQLDLKSLTKGRSRRAMEILPEDKRFPCQTNEGNNLSRKKNLLFDENNFCNSNEYFNDSNTLNVNVGSNEYGLGQYSNPDAFQNLTTIVRVTFELPNGQIITKVKSACLQECQKYFNWPDE